MFASFREAKVNSDAQTLARPLQPKGSKPTPASDATVATPSAGLELKKFFTSDLSLFIQQEALRFIPATAIGSADLYEQQTG